MLLHLTRHGQPEAWSEDVSDAEGLLGGDPVLSEAGIEQAARLGKHLQMLGFHGRIWSSPYRRAAQTADVVAGELGLTFNATPELRDIVKDATPRHHLVGMNLDQLQKVYRHLNPNGHELPYPWWTTESDDRTEFTRRLLAFVEPAVSEGGDLLLVGHGATVNQLTQVFTVRAGRGDLGTWFGAWNAQLTTFEISRSNVRLVRLADVSFLPSELITANTARYVDGHDGQTGGTMSCQKLADTRGSPATRSYA